MRSSQEGRHVVRHCVEFVERLTEDKTIAKELKWDEAAKELKCARTNRRTRKGPILSHG